MQTSEDKLRREQEEHYTLEKFWGQDRNKWRIVREGKIRYLEGSLIARKERSTYKGGGGRGDRADQKMVQEKGIIGRDGERNECRKTKENKSGWEKARGNMTNKTKQIDNQEEFKQQDILPKSPKLRIKRENSKEIKEN